MRRTALLLVALASLAVIPAGADHGTGIWEQTGTILLPNPTTRLYSGVAERGSPCGGSIDQDVPPDTFNGTDGFWFRLPDGAAHHAARLTADADLPDPVGLIPGNDVDAWFFDEDCNLIRPSEEPSAYHMTTAGSNEFGVVPLRAAWVVVDLVTGVNVTFSFRILDWPDAAA